MKQQQWMLTLAASAIALIPLSGVAADSMEDRLMQLEKKVAHLGSSHSYIKRSTNHLNLKPLNEEGRDHHSVVMGNHFIISKDKNLVAGLYGQVNRALQIADDGYETYFNNVDNDHSSTRIGIYGTADFTDELKAWADIQVEMESNSTARISQTNSSQSTNFVERKLQLFFTHTRFGKLAFGQGSMASDGTAEVNFLDTGDISYSAVSYIGGGYMFRADGVTGSNTLLENADANYKPSIGNIFDNFDGLGRDDRIRYDTPEYMGFSGATSFARNRKYDFALRHHWENDMLKWQAAVGYAKNAGATTLSGSAAIMHKATGLSLSGSAAEYDDNTTDRNDENFYSVQLGWQHVFCPNWGNTAFAVDWARSDDQFANGDRGNSLGFGVEQHFDKYSTHVYAGVRKFDYDSANPGLSFDDVVVGLLGARVTF